MTIRPIKEIARDDSGRGILKFTFGVCLLATIGATTSPAFKANPLIGGTIMKFRSHLPETLQKVTDALQ